MEQFQIETAQNISISQNTAHLGERMLAYLIDSFIIWAYIILMVLLLFTLEIDSGDFWALYMVVSLPAFLLSVRLIWHPLKKRRSGQKIVAYLL